MAVFVPGGAGYIGSHNVRALAGQGEEVVVLDNLLTGHRQSLGENVRFYRGDLRDGTLLDVIFRDCRVDAVIHFAASSLVGESMLKPLYYFNNNIQGMQSLLEAMLRNGVDKIVFSSSAAVYGEPEVMPIGEDCPRNPLNPYGESKLVMERMMRWCERAHGMRSVILRYFNVAGAWPDGSIGEDHDPESHLVPLVLQVPLGKRAYVTIFGDDYPTPDGTCIRDYLHVMDLVEAHVLALRHLRAGGGSLVCNLGSGRGFSVREIIDAARRVTGRDIPERTGQRRAGDPPRLVACSDMARRKLGWHPRGSLDDMIGSAWRWHLGHPRGYR